MVNQQVGVQTWAQWYPNVLAGTADQVSIEAIVRGCGVCNVVKASPYNYKATAEAIENLKAKPGVKVLIAEEPCVLFARRTLKQIKPMVAYVAEQTDAVKDCLANLACPAFYMKDGRVEINEHQCTGCMFCLQICKDIKARKRSA